VSTGRGPFCLLGRGQNGPLGSVGGGVAQTVFHALEVAWIETTSFLSKTWTRFTSGFQKVWQSASSFVAKRMLEIQGLFDSGLDVEAAKRAVAAGMLPPAGGRDDPESGSAATADTGASLCRDVG